jgi:hypothetical protein
VNSLAADWTAIGSIAGGLGAVAAFLAILVTVAVYLFQSRHDRAEAIRKDLQFIHGQQAQIVPSITSGLLVIIYRQIREFRDCLGPGASPSDLLDQLFGEDPSSNNRSLFQASALDSNLSSATYSRMSDIWDGLDLKARELSGALRVFSYACQVLTQQSRHLCDPGTTTDVLDTLAESGDRDVLSAIDDIDELTNRLLSAQIDLVKRQDADPQKRIQRIGQGCFFIGMLSDLIRRLPDKDLLRLSRKDVQPPDIDQLKENPREAIEASLDHLRPTLPERHLDALKAVIGRWNPRPQDLSELPAPHLKQFRPTAT